MRAAGRLNVNRRYDAVGAERHARSVGHAIRERLGRRRNLGRRRHQLMPLVERAVLRPVGGARAAALAPRQLQVLALAPLEQTRVIRRRLLVRLVAAAGAAKQIALERKLRRDVRAGRRRRWVGDGDGAVEWRPPVGLGAVVGEWAESVLVARAAALQRGGRLLLLELLQSRHLQQQCVLMR